MSKAVLKPCPFCGGDQAEILAPWREVGRPLDEPATYAKVTCPSCCVYIEACVHHDIHATQTQEDYLRLVREKAGRKWNRRAGDE